MEQPDKAAACLEMGSRLGTRSSAVLPTATVDFAIFKSFKSGWLHGGGINLMVSRSVDGRLCDIIMDTYSSISIA